MFFLFLVANWPIFPVERFTFDSEEVSECVWVGLLQSKMLAQALWCPHLRPSLGMCVFMFIYSLSCEPWQAYLPLFTCEDLSDMNIGTGAQECSAWGTTLWETALILFLTADYSKEHGFLPHPHHVVKQQWGWSWYYIIKLSCPLICLSFRGS